MDGPNGTNPPGAVRLEHSELSSTLPPPSLGNQNDHSRGSPSSDIDDDQSRAGAMRAIDAMIDVSYYRAPSLMQTLTANYRENLITPSEAGSPTKGS